MAVVWEVEVFWGNFIVDYRPWTYDRFVVAVQGKLMIVSPSIHI